jgi:hypothetical protein
LKQRAEAGEIVLLSLDEGRFPMVPTATPTLGVQGHRPRVGTWDCKDLLYLFAVVNLLNRALHSNTLESPKDAKKKTGKSKNRDKRFLVRGVAKEELQRRVVELLGE